jgi:hypothetical protein
LKDGERQALDVKAGDRVLFGKYSSSEVKIDGEELLIMREDEILGIISRAGAVAGSASGAGETDFWLVETPFTSLNRGRLLDRAQLSQLVIVQ